jgi:hypothetical protein
MKWTLKELNMWPALVFTESYSSQISVLYTPVTQPGLTWKFRKSWTVLYEITKRISELNYEFMDQWNKKHVVHISHLKKDHNQILWDSKPRQKTRNSVLRQPANHPDTSEEDEIKFGPFALVTSNTPIVSREYITPTDQMLDAPDSATPALDTPSSEHSDPSYRPPETPRSRRQLQTTCPEPPVTRSRTRILSQDTVNV